MIKVQTLKQFLITAMFSSLLMSPEARAEATIFKFVPIEGKVSFLAVGHPSAIKIRGEGSGPEGQLLLAKDGLSGTLTFSISSLKTGIEMRDTHMKEKYLEIDKYPTAELKITNLKLAADLNAKDQNFSGLLKLWSCPVKTGHPARV